MITDNNIFPWETLISHIKENQVVPVLGDNVFFFMDDKGGIIPAAQYVRNELAKKFCCEPDMIDIESAIRKDNRERNGEKTELYQEINRIVENKEVIVPQALQDFLSINHFPLIVTTSCYPGIASALSISEDKTIVYRKSSGNDVRINDNGGIVSPTLYYMFGRSSGVQYTYSYDEDNFLEFLHYWHNEYTRPPEFCKFVKEKLLLILGCDYPDWVFRFLWHSLRSFVRPSHCDSISALSSVETDPGLTCFLLKSNTYRRDEPEAFLEQVYKEYKLKNPDARIAKADSYAIKRMEKLDFFISYASEDRALAEEVFRILSRQSDSVWLDTNELKNYPGDPWDDIIKYNIEHTRYFIPIITNNVMKGGRYFRKEWTYAEKHSGQWQGFKYIIPVKFGNIDLNGLHLPSVFTDSQMLDFSQESERDMQVRELVREARRGE